MAKPFYVCLIKTSEYGIKLLLLDTMEIAAWETEVEALNYWQSGWGRGLSYGGGFAAGAAISFMQLQPSIVYVGDAQWIIDTLVGSDKLQPMRLRGGATSPMNVCNVSDKANEIWEGGAKPRLI